MKSIRIALVVLAVVVCPAAVWGNYNPCTYGWGGNIESVTQNGQDIHFEFHFINPSAYECGYPPDGPIMLWRINEIANKRVLIGDVFLFSPRPSGECECSEYLDSRLDSSGIRSKYEDCDGDGIDECPPGCCSDYYVEWNDSCPPPGATTYDLSSYGETDFSMDGSPTPGFLCLSSEAVNVDGANESCGPWEDEDPENVDPCLYPGGVVPDDDTGWDDDQDDEVDDDANDDTDDDADDDDAGSTGDDDDDDNDDSCGGCTASGDPAFPLAAIMFAVGLVALVVTRRKR